MTYLIAAITIAFLTWVGSALVTVLRNERNLAHAPALFEDSPLAELCAPTLWERIQVAYRSRVAARFNPWPPKIVTQALPRDTALDT